MVVVLSHIHYIIRVYANTSGKVQFSITTAILPKLSQELSLCCEHLDTMAKTVSHINIIITV